MGLKNVLKDFHKEEQPIIGDEAPEQFKRVAQAILSGYFLVRQNTTSPGEGIDDKKDNGEGNSKKEIKVRPISVEIYYHEEEGPNKDYIVYHRNPSKGNKKKQEKPYFAKGTLNCHVSGIDITFESDDKVESHEKGKYRASALIRAFKMENANDETLALIEIPDASKEERSTRLYNALFSVFDIFNGFSVTWVDDEEVTDIPDMHISVRKNVALYDSASQEKIVASKNALEEHSRGGGAKGSCNRR